MNILTFKNFKQTLVVGAIAGAVLLGISFATKADRFSAADMQPTLTEVFGVETSATDQCQEPNETLILTGEMSDTLERTRTIKDPGEMTKINNFFLLRGIFTFFAQLEVYRDIDRPGEVYLVFYNKLGDKLCAADANEVGDKGFWLEERFYNDFLKETGLVQDGV